MLKSARGKSAARKPLADVSNGDKLGKTKSLPSLECEDREASGPPEISGAGGGCDGVEDHLLLVRSDISNLLNQIDELVVQALQHNMISKTGSQDIESFSNALSDIHLSLKPWIPRLQQAFSATLVASEEQPAPSIDTNSSNSDSEEENDVHHNEAENELDLIVSPSPLVSWRTGSCTVERGKQLFLLTPLPKQKILSSRYRDSSQLKVGAFTDLAYPRDTLGLPPLSVRKCACDDLVERAGTELGATDVSRPCIMETKISTFKCDHFSPLQSPDHKSKKSSVYLWTPCLKATPLKRGVPTNPIPEGSSDDNKDFSKPTEENDSEIRNVFTSEEHFAPKYGDILGLPIAPNFNRRKDTDESLDWFLSPPKTCVLMEPSDEKLLPTPAHGAFLATPLPMGFESTVRKGTKPGESTLKRELWVRFDAASTSGLHFDPSAFQKTARGFMDKLEEASCEKDPDSRTAT